MELLNISFYYTNDENKKVANIDLTLSEYIDFMTKADSTNITIISAKW
jgi:hypothetical protein